MTTGRFDLRSCLPEVLSIDEALLIADAEYHLTDHEKDWLGALLAGMHDEPPVEDPQEPIRRLTAKLEASSLMRGLLRQAMEGTVARIRARRELDRDAPE